MKKNKLSEALQELCENADGKAEMFAVLNQDRDVDIAICGDDDTSISVRLGALIADYFNDSGDEETGRIAEILVNSVEAVLLSHSRAGIKLVERLFKCFAYGVERDSEQSVGCDECALMRVCDDEQAVEYRKRHHIPKPKRVNKK